MNIISLIALSFITLNIITAIVLYIVLTIIVNYIDALRYAIKQRKGDEKNGKK